MYSYLILAKIVLFACSSIQKFSFFLSWLSGCHIMAYLMHKWKPLKLLKICCRHLKLKKCLTYVTLTEFWKLNATCNISPETAELRIWMTLKEMRQTRRAGLLNVKGKGMTICYIMNRCLVMYLSGEKVDVVQYWWFCCQCKDKFC